MTDAEQSDTSIAFCEQHWFHCELLNISHLSEVVYIVIAAELVEWAELF